MFNDNQETDPKLIREEEINFKLKQLNELVEKPGFDTALKPVLERFYRLPFSTLESCSGHTLHANPNQIDNQYTPHLAICDDIRVFAEDRKIQEDFRNHISEVENNINARFTGKAVKIELQGYTREEGYDNEGYPIIVEQSLEDSVADGSGYVLWIKISQANITDRLGREILTAIWQEFYKYLGNFDRKELPQPDFDEGNIFVEKQDNTKLHNNYIEQEQP